MEMKDFVPWNWFKREEEEGIKIVPGKGTKRQAPAGMHDLRQEIDRVFDDAMDRFGMIPTLFKEGFPRMGSGILKPTLDLSASDKEYNLTVEIPGVDEKDVEIEIHGDSMVIKGEKKLEKETEEDSFYCMERSYGAFRRVLNLPDDADREAVKAVFDKGVLKVTIPKKAISSDNVKKVEIKKG